MRRRVLLWLAGVILVVGVTVAIALPLHRCPPNTMMEVVNVPYRQVVCFGSEGAGPVESRAPLKVGVGIGSVLAAAMIVAVARRQG